jgi:putative hydrolase of the HAD superfamily
MPEEPRLIEQLAEELAEGVLAVPPPLLPAVREILPQLAERYRLALISDTAFSPGCVLRELLRRYGLAELFSAYSFSDETGVAKPHPRAYLTVLDELRARPEEALHIGDLEETDVRGAKRLGMQAILFLGDPESEFPPPERTSADCIAYSWREVPDLIPQLQDSDRANAAP